MAMRKLCHRGEHFAPAALNDGARALELLSSTAIIAINGEDNDDEMSHRHDRRRLRYAPTALRGRSMAAFGLRMLQV